MAENFCANEPQQRIKLLKEFKAELELKVQERTAELEKANCKLEKANQAKSDFVNVVFHELRTPLTSIKSFTEILREDGDDLELAERKRFLTIISDETDRLTRLINDLLDLQRLDSGRMLWRDSQLDLQVLLRESIDLFHAAYSKKGLSLILHSADDGEPYEFLGDSDKIKQVLSNLLSNALKFTLKGGVEVTLKRSVERVSGNSFYLLSVKDSGQGIAAEEQESVFDRFHQLQESDEGGSGLGLAICREYVEHYQGSIQVSSVPEGGSNFTVMLPEQIKNRKRLGQILVESGVVTESEIEQALRQQRGP